MYDISWDQDKILIWMRYAQSIRSDKIHRSDRLTIKYNFASNRNKVASCNVLIKWYYVTHINHLTFRFKIKRLVNDLVSGVSYGALIGTNYQSVSFLSNFQLIWVMQIVLIIQTTPRFFSLIARNPLYFRSSDSFSFIVPYRPSDFPFLLQRIHEPGVFYISAKDRRLERRIGETKQRSFHEVAFTEAPYVARTCTHANRRDSVICHDPSDSGRFDSTKRGIGKRLSRNFILQRGHIDLSCELSVTFTTATRWWPSPCFLNGLMYSHLFFCEKYEKLRFSNL